MREGIPEFQTAHITITREIGADGSDTHYVETSHDLGFIECLGLIEAAKDTLIRRYMGELEDGGA